MLNLFLDVTKKESYKNYLKNVKEKSILIFSPTSLKKAEIISNPNITYISSHKLTKDIKNIDKICNIDGIKNIISFGGGTASDIAKYIAFKNNIFLTCIPTMLSTNVYATNKVALVVDGRKITLDAKMPDEIILDCDLLKMSPVLNLYGLADIFSIHTALNDWKLANKHNNEAIDNKIFDLAEKLLEETISFVLKNEVSEILNDIEKMYYLVGFSGHITNVYGTGKPESGSEHIFAKELEHHINIPHGISVSIEIILMSVLQNNMNEKIVKCLKKIKTLESAKKDYEINDKLLLDILEKLKPREDRFSILNITNIKNQKSDLINKYNKFVE